MSLRKSIHFKPLCLLVAALLTGQCISVEKGKLISTEEKVIDNGVQEYVYGLEMIKAPTPQDPTIEYRITKFPANRVESSNIYKRRRVDGTCPILFGAVSGTCLGYSMGSNLTPHEDGKYHSSLVGLVLGLALGATFLKKIIGTKSDSTLVIKEQTRSYLQKKSDSFPIPAQYFPLELKWGPNGKGIVFKTRTDEQGIVRIHLIDDLKMSKYPPDRSLILFIHYLKPESQLKGVLTDSLEPEK